MDRIGGTGFFLSDPGLRVHAVSSTADSVHAVDNSGAVRTSDNSSVSSSGESINPDTDGQEDRYQDIENSYGQSEEHEETEKSDNGISSAKDRTSIDLRISFDQWVEQSINRLNSVVNFLDQDISLLITKINANKTNADNGIKYANDRITSLTNRMNSHDTWAGNLSQLVTNNRDNINNHVDHINNLYDWATDNTNVINNHASVLNNHAGIINSNSNAINNHSTILNNHSHELNLHVKAINTNLNGINTNANLISANTDRITNLTNRVTYLENWITSIVDRQSVWNAGQTVWNANQTSLIKSLQNSLNKEISDRQNGDTNLDKAIQKEIADRIHADGNQDKVVQREIADRIYSDEQLNKIIQREITDRQYSDGQLDKIIQREIVDRQYSDEQINKVVQREITDRKFADEKVNKSLTKEIEDRKNSDTLIAGNFIRIEALIAALNERIDNLSFDFSDLKILAAIALSMKSNEDLWTAEHYDGGTVSENEGKAVRLFKVQFQESRSLFSHLMKHYFDMDNPTSTIYRLRYSIVAGFEETKDMLLEWFTHLLESSNTTNSHLSSVNTWLELQNTHFKKIYEVLCIITDWLELIYQKPPPVVNVTIPPIELDENGNGWLKTLIKTVGDVMKTAIETLGSLLETAIGEVGQLLRDLLAFLDGLIDDLLHLIVPENLDFMDHKFDSTSKTIKLKFGSIFDGIDSFKSLFGSKAVFKDIEINLGTFGNGSFKLPVSVLNDMAPFVKALITGAVALEFLIDMYKWFHTKGEVIE